MWKLCKIEITYPSINSSDELDNYLDKYYSIDGLYFSYENCQLQFSFDSEKIVYLVDLTDKKNPNIIESTFDKLESILLKYNLPIFEPVISNEGINFLFYENDDDGNHDTQTNIEFIKNGDYGYPVKYKSEYLLNEYEFTSNLDLKKTIENLVVENIKINLKEYISGNK